MPVQALEIRRLMRAGCLPSMLTTKTFLRSLAALGCALTVLLTPPAQAQERAEFTHPIRLVVPFPAGGPTDIVARPLAQALSAALGQQVVVDNRGGAGGNIGAAAVAQAPADGYTLLLGTVGTNAINQSLYKSLPFDPGRDFTPISLLASAPVVLVVHPSVPAKTLSEFLALARAEPGKVSYGTAGAGSPGHLTGAIFADMAGVKLLHVPYKGSAPAIADLQGGQIMAMFDPVQSPLAHIRAGNLRAIAVSGRQRSPVLPEVPTVAESGVPGFETGAWWALFAPAGLPPQVLARLEAETVRVMQSPRMREQLGALGIEAIGSDAARLKSFVAAEVPKWARAVEASGASID
jgi:tripartite-type tricarboxylate transporter receptor subunit TctC